MAAEQHALLGASTSHRWLHCTPSARLEETIPDKTSEYAEEGRLAHAIAELRLRKYLTPMGPETFRLALEELRANPRYQQEMDGFVGVYFDYILDLLHAFPSPPYAAIEQRLDYSAYVPGGFGTGDCVIIHGTTLLIIDLKYGKGVPVSADNNPQMKLYALGAWLTYGFLYPIERVKLAIVQPRLDTISEWETTLTDLLAWGDSIKPLAQQAWDGTGDCAAGEWCQFCRARSTCRARMDYYLALETWNAAQPPLITNDEVGAILSRAEGLAAWVKHLEVYALTECLAGREIPGWKAVEGRAIRAISDIDKAIELLKGTGIDEAMLFTRKPITLTEMEKLTGKKKLAELLNPLITVPPGKPALAPMTDKRQAITRISAEQDFAESEETES